ncbi:MAG TPA: hypothetical protein VH250_08765 [Granulicella sp.]|nr:hypothetical protein [Granulicella sp.]
MRTYAALWRPILALSLAFCALWLIVSTWAWPFVGDASYVHYCVFLIQRGLHPCRDIVDVTLPGAYLAEQAVMATFGPGALAWRLYDLVLMASTTAATLYLLAPQRPAAEGKAKSQSEALLAGAFASVLLFAVHAQDGVNMLGERDLEVGIALLVSLALLAFLRRHHATANALQQTLLATLAGFLSAAAFTIKPTAALTILVLLGWMLWLRRQHRFSTLPIAAFTLSGLLTVAALALYLWQQSALAAFFTECNTIVRYHASLDHRPLGYLLAHCFSPIMLLVSLWLLLRILAALLPSAEPGTEPTLLAQAKQNPDLLAIALCAATGFVSYLAQRKGFSYQRYPLLIFLLPLIARDLFHFLHARRAVRALAALAIATGLGMVLFFTHRATTFERTAPNQQLLADIATYGGPALDHRIQCMDAAGGCIAALYQARLVESTGFLHDCYMLSPTNPVSLALRQRFFAELARNPPQVFVVTNSVCYSDPSSFDKYARWPEFRQYLATHYTLARERSNLPPEHYWSRTTEPFAYRIYTRNH